MFDSLNLAIRARKELAFVVSQAEKENEYAQNTHSKHKLLQKTCARESFCRRV